MQRPPAAQTAATRAVWSGAAPARGSGTGFVFGVIGIVIGAALLLLVIAYFTASFGAGAVVISALVALLPLLGVLFAVRWIDRWEPEPRFALAFALLWGAGVAVAIALLVDLFVQITLAIGCGGTSEASEALSVTGGIGDAYDFVSAVIQAPIVEEGGKGLGLLLIFFVARKYFDGPVDGIAYAAIVAGGFAFTENILYFGGQLGAGEGVVEIFVLRGLMSPFAHVMFTACTGIALGIAARRAGTLGSIGIFFLGLIPAILLHALWNGALFIVSDFYVYYALVQFPLFLGFVGLVVWLRKRETALTKTRLEEYARVGWFAEGEVISLATGRGRRQARQWAAQRGLGEVMKKYTKDATRLAFTRQRLISRRATEGAQAEESALLASIVAGRALLQGAPQR